LQNWDEESSDDEEGSDVVEDPEMMENEPEETKNDVKRKRQRISGKQ
jgi:hypothetical protein